MVGTVLLVTGDRFWSDRELIAKVLMEAWALGYRIVRHGANGYDERGHSSFRSGKPTVRGADMLVHEEAIKLGFEVDPMPAEWGRFGKGAGPKRNQAMLDKGGIGLAAAFHDNLDESRGTADMVRRCRRAGLDVCFVHH
jgi:hypothetical protein